MLTATPHVPYSAVVDTSPNIGGGGIWLPTSYEISIM